MCTLLDQGLTYSFCNHYFWQLFDISKDYLSNAFRTFSHFLKNVSLKKKLYLKNIYIFLMITMPNFNFLICVVWQTLQFRMFFTHRMAIRTWNTMFVRASAVTSNFYPLIFKWYKIYLIWSKSCHRHIDSIIFLSVRHSRNCVEI